MASSPRGEPFVYPVYGAYAHGFEDRSQYQNARQLDIYRPGWSWTPHTRAAAPFCYGETCYDVTEICASLDGTVLSDSICSFPRDVQVAGPSCWSGDCRETSSISGTTEIVSNAEACTSVGGTTIGEGSTTWCLVPSGYTLFGPACWDDVCYQSELELFCTSVGGTLYAQIYCLIPGKHVVIGPTCFGPACYESETAEACSSVNGTSIADRWCVLQDRCDYSVLGPTCWGDDCYPVETSCESLGGTAFPFTCLLRGEEWTMLGPTCNSALCAITQNQLTCQEVNGVYVGGPFCLFEGSYSMLGPVCLGNQCFTTETIDFCETQPGVIEVSSAPFCLFPTEVYQQVSFPLCWNENCTSGNPTVCSNGLFCTVWATVASNQPYCPSPGAPTAPPAAAVAPVASPAAPTAAPVAPTAAPVALTAAPVDPTAAPVVPTAVPVAPTAAPVPMTPQLPTVAPVTPVPAPTAQDDPTTIITIPPPSNPPDSLTTPTEVPAIPGGPTAPPAPTTTPLIHPAYGASSFGSSPTLSVYSGAGHLDIRRPGWSWTSSSQSAPPFCHGSVCHNVTKACLEFGGIVLADSICSFPPDVIVAGVSCWSGNCTEASRGNMTNTEACSLLSGTTVGEGAESWCIVKGKNTLLGPVCWGDECFYAELENFCDQIGGIIYAQMYCIMPGLHTVVGPTCYGDSCATDSTIAACGGVEGINVADRFCVLEDRCDFAALGPTCWKETCESSSEVCASVNGISFGEHFCLLSSQLWTLLGPTCYMSICATARTEETCNDLRGKYVGGPFCFVPESYAFLGPVCRYDECFATRTTEYCRMLNGVDIQGAPFCLLDRSEFPQVSYPLCWNDTCWRGNPNFCKDDLFCVVDAEERRARPLCPAAPLELAPTAAPTQASMASSIASHMHLFTSAILFVNAFAAVRFLFS